MHWFDIREGKMIVGSAAYESVIEQSGPGDIVPLGELIATDPFDIDYSSFEKLPPRIKTPSQEECRTYGSWVLNILDQYEPDTPLVRGHLERLSRLGLGMSYYSMTRAFGNSREAIATNIGRPNFQGPNAFADWTLQDFVKNAQRLANVLDRKPTKPDYVEWARQGNGPGPTVIYTQVPGGVRKLNELLGYPDVHSWELEDYIDWGVHFMQANDGLVPSMKNVDTLSQRKRGPSAAIVKRMFKKFSNYITQIEHEYAVTFGSDEVLVNTSDVGPRDARFQVLNYFMREITNEEVEKLADRTNSQNLIKTIIAKNPGVRAGDIEVYISNSHLYDVIWPHHNDYAYLRIIPENPCDTSS